MARMTAPLRSMVLVTMLAAAGCGGSQVSAREEYVKTELAARTERDAAVAASQAVYDRAKAEHEAAGAELLRLLKVNEDTLTRERGEAERELDRRYEIMRSKKYEGGDGREEAEMRPFLNAYKLQWQIAGKAYDRANNDAKLAYASAKARFEQAEAVYAAELRAAQAKYAGIVEAATRELFVATGEAPPAR